VDSFAARVISGAFAGLAFVDAGATRRVDGDILGDLA